MIACRTRYARFSDIACIYHLRQSADERITGETERGGDWRKDIQGRARRVGGQCLLERFNLVLLLFFGHGVARLHPDIFTALSSSFVEN